MMVKPGEAFGPYRTVKLLGEGGMGEVWLVQHEANGYLFAAKFLNGENAEIHESRKRFLHEAQLAMSIQHPNLVKVYDVGQDPDTGLCYIMMEYVCGGSLRDRIDAQGTFSVRSALQIVRGIASVLVATSSRHIVHRDIKPDNILFTMDGVPKLSDLGIARVRTDKSLSTVTSDGVVIGTPAYMSPEQLADSHHVDVRADIYSLGIVFFEMLTGRRPWKDESTIQVISRAVQRKEIIDVRNLRRDVPEGVAALIRRMCAARFDHRLSSPQRLVRVCDMLLGRSTPQKVVHRTSRPTVRAGAWQDASEDGSHGGLGPALWIVLALLVLGLIVLIAAR